MPILVFIISAIFKHISLEFYKFIVLDQYSGCTKFGLSNFGKDRAVITQIYVLAPSSSFAEHNKI